MMSFSIKFLDMAVPTKLLTFDEESRFAQITMGDFSERIIIPIDYWSIEDYYRQWIEALERVLTKSKNVKSALITEMYDPDKPRFAMMCWLLYKESTTVYIQNQYIPYNMLPMPFKTENVYACIDNRKTTTEDGAEISEWQCSLADMNHFLDELKGKSSRKLHL